MEFDYRGWVVGGGLPIECWPDSALLELRSSIARALGLGRVRGAALLTALDWADAVDAELQARRSLPTLEEAVLGGCDCNFGANCPEVLQRREVAVVRAARVRLQLSCMKTLKRLASGLFLW